MKQQHLGTFIMSMSQDSPPQMTREYPQPTTDNDIVSIYYISSSSALGSFKSRLEFSNTGCFNQFHKFRRTIWSRCWSIMFLCLKVGGGEVVVEGSLDTRRNKLTSLSVVPLSTARLIVPRWITWHHLVEECSKKAHIVLLLLPLLIVYP